jgi:hypothetical protein
MARDWGFLRSPVFAVAGWILALVSLIALTINWISYRSVNNDLISEVGVLEEELADAERLREEYAQDAAGLRSDVSRLQISLSNIRGDYEELQEQLHEAVTELEEQSEPPPSEPQPTLGTIPGEGIFQAGPGGDFPPGTYRSTGGQSCYWARLKDPSGNFNAIIANGLGANQTVQIGAHEWFQTADCGEWKQVG